MARTNNIAHFQTTLGENRGPLQLGVDWRWLTHSYWGPGGSVGFELATGKRTTIPRSDLDIVVYANEHLSRSDA
jgi:Phosphoribosyl-dephospho-CoA transferase MdcG